MRPFGEGIGQGEGGEGHGPHRLPGGVLNGSFQDGPLVFRGPGDLRHLLGQGGVIADKVPHGQAQVPRRPGSVPGEVGEVGDGLPLLVQEDGLDAAAGGGALLHPLEGDGLGAEPALLPGGEGHGARQGHVVEDVELPVVAQGLADVEGEVGAPVGDVHVLDAGGQGGCHGLVNLELLGHGRVQLGLPLGRTAGGQGKEEQKAEGE